MLIRTALALEGLENQISIENILSDLGVLVIKVGNNPKLIAQQSCDIIFVSDLKAKDFKSEIEGELTQTPGSPELIVISKADDELVHGELLAWGSSAVLSANLPLSTLKEAIGNIIQRRIDSVRSVDSYQEFRTIPRLKDFFSRSPTMNSFMNLARRVVNSNASLLLTGETGVGKERLAVAIHKEGNRARGPFVPVNCAAIPDNLLESELFGHEKGAFTGAVKTRRGAFELAHNGTIFLDEIGELPLHLQAKLLRVLQEKEFQKVGAENRIKIDVRIMAATNKNLLDEVKKGNFRQDLYYRLGVVSLQIPPLKERVEDIPYLVEGYIKVLQNNIGTSENIQVSNEAMKALYEYEWPGNIRELINVIERAILLCEEGKICLSDLPEEISKERLKESSETDGIYLDVKSDEWSEFVELPVKNARKKVILNFEKKYFSSLLAKYNGKIKDVANHAGVSTRAVFDFMKRTGLKKEDYKS